MGFAGYVTVTKKKQADKHTQETTKINEEKQNRKNTNGNAQCDHVQKKKKKKKQKTSEADSFI
jgi:hypothetical protein